jgi:hypothetical protein
MRNSIDKLHFWLGYFIWNFHKDNSIFILKVSDCFAQFLLNCFLEVNVLRHYNAPELILLEFLKNILSDFFASFFIRNFVKNIGFHYILIDFVIPTDIKREKNILIFLLNFFLYFFKHWIIKHVQLLDIYFVY